MTLDTRDSPTDAQAVRSASTASWEATLQQVAQLMAARGVLAARTVVLLPYAQMMAQARQAWAAQRPDGLSPRFETSRNWAASLAPFVPSGTDLSGDMARDSLVASHWLDRMAGPRVDRAFRKVLVNRLVEMTRQLAPLASARAPEDRLAWVAQMQEALSPGVQHLPWEALLVSLALTWAGHSAYATDVLWDRVAAPGAAADLVVVVPGFQHDALVTALAASWGAHAVTVDAPALPAGATGQPVQLHACADAQDEAERAAACVLAHLQAGRRPVALVATDRLLTRRIGALLGMQGLSQQDETGWRLSTTHAAARIMTLLRAAAPSASVDDWLDLLKQGGNWSDTAVDALEARVRRQGTPVRAGAWLQEEGEEASLVALAEQVRALQAPRRLTRWLSALRECLLQMGWWEWLNQDAAGQQLVQALHLEPARATSLTAALTEAAESIERDRWPLSALTAWIREALEATNFTSLPGGDPDVVVLPMAQLLGRPFAAVVAPGCDEIRLPATPEPPGTWTAPQRELLGMPSREALAEAARAAWDHMLAYPCIDALWRTQDQAETTLPCPWVRQLSDPATQGTGWQASPDPRTIRSLRHEPQARPEFGLAGLMPTAISASAYQDLRDCPYRFMALRQWRLREMDELDDAPDKRDMGLWLHAVLGRFHDERRDGVEPQEADLARMDRIAMEEAKRQGLWALSDEGAPGFLPFLAAWPRLRDGYLQWLETYEGGAGQPVFVRSEASLKRTLGNYQLVGQLDRMDRLEGEPQRGTRWVIDYKTEPRDVTRRRVQSPLEDTQLAFYAALLDDDQSPVAGGYLSITDSHGGKGADTPTRMYEHEELADARDALLQGLSQDLDRVAAGHAMSALGEGRVCEYCAARGLCRKDFWGAQA